MILGICTPFVARIVTNALQDAESSQAIESTADGAEPESYQPPGLIIRALRRRSSMAGELRFGVFIGIRSRWLVLMLMADQSFPHKPKKRIASSQNAV